MLLKNITYSSINVYSQHLLSTCCVLGTIVGSGDTFRDKIDKKSCPWRKTGNEQINQSLMKEQVAVSSKNEHKSKEEERKKERNCDDLFFLF